MLLGLCACGPQANVEVSHPAAPGFAASSSCAPVATIEARRDIPFGFYSVPLAAFDRLAHAGVTMVGPYYGARPSYELLDAAQRAGLGVLYPVGLEAPRMDDEGRAELVAQIDAVAEHEAVVGWYVLPEELRPWSEAEMLYAARVQAVVRTHDPLDRPLLSYQPNHRTRDDLASASASFDRVLRGLYANFVGATERRAWVREGARTIVASAYLDQDPWAVLEMFEEPAETSRIGAWVRHDVYASLVVGARGVVVFSGWPRSGFPAYEAYLSAYLEVASELNGPRGLATPLLRGLPAEPTALEVVDGPARTDAAMGDTPRWVDSVASRQVHDGGGRWIYTVNSAQQAVQVRIALDPTACPAVAVLGPDVREGVIDLPPLGVSVVRVPDATRGAGGAVHANHGKTDGRARRRPPSVGRVSGLVP